MRTGLAPINFVQMTDLVVRKALADPHRARIVEELRGAPEGLDVRELGRRLALHENTVRWHLGLLADARLVDSRRTANGKPGRPRMVYALVRGAEHAMGRDEHRLLATILTGAVSGIPDAERCVEKAGHAWGRYLVRRPSPLERVTDDQAVGELARLLDEEGFSAEAHGREIHMRRCPFHELAETNPGVVCAVHRGLMAGALEELGSGLRVEGLDVFVRPDLCVARLRERELAERLQVRQPDSDQA
jgi:predicted ArsR family transcriptional regulator